MKKRLIATIFAVCIMLMAFTASALAMDGNAETLTIKGDGVSQEITWTRAQLEALTEGISQNVYSVANNFPTDKVMYRKGISLLYLLKQAGVKDTAQELKFISSDGYSRTFTYQELLKDVRYYFAADGSKTKVPTIIAFTDSTKGFDSTSDTELVLTMGQRVKGEQNNPWFVKYLGTIEVSTAAPQEWPQPTFSQTSGPEGVSITLKHSNFDTVKMYYTLDGSDPTINSKLFNVSASYYQPALNQPIIINNRTEIRAVAIGAGKMDSAVASTMINGEGAMFNDLGDYPWARAEIEDLCTKGIIKGMGQARFAPAEPLTRAQFATMIVLALGEKPVPGSDSSFADVKSPEWYYGYVEKAAAMGLIKGYPDKTFGPNKVLSRQEMIAIVVQAMGVKVTSDSISPDLLAPFYCETRVSDWARGYLACAENLGILEHGHMVVETDKGLSLNAQAPATRAEAAVAVYRMLDPKTK